MRSFLKATAVAATFAGASLFASAPAEAGVSFGITIGVPNAVVVDDESGGYCDRWGCPDEYWGYPVWYGPVYYDGAWFNGPAYYRDFGGQRWFWVHGGWRRDEWRGPRPRWWRSDYRAGPALGYEFYLGHGFRHGRDRFWRGNDWRPGRDWDRNRWEREHGGERMHPDHGSLTGRVNGMFGGHDNDRHDGDHHDNGHHDNDHHDNDHHGDHGGGGQHGSGNGGGNGNGNGNGDHKKQHGN